MYQGLRHHFKSWRFKKGSTWGEKNKFEEFWAIEEKNLLVRGEGEESMPPAPLNF